MKRLEDPDVNVVINRMEELRKDPGVEIVGHSHSIIWSILDNSYLRRDQWYV